MQKNIYSHDDVIKDQVPAVGEIVYCTDDMVNFSSPESLGHCTTGVLNSIDRDSEWAFIVDDACWKFIMPVKDAKPFISSKQLIWLDDKIIDDGETFNTCGICTVFDYCYVHPGDEGYASNDLYDFTDLNRCKYGKIISVECSRHPFRVQTETNEMFAQFFLPKTYCKSDPTDIKNYRPYTFQEFVDKFELHNEIRYRDKISGREYAGIFCGFECDSNGEHEKIHVGCYAYSLKELFDEYEYQQPCMDNYEPFGMFGG